MSIAVPFPETQPQGYEWLDDEPVFDPDLHLAIESPDEIVLLTNLGYGEDEIATKATPVAASSPFRVLSDEGAAVLLDTARRLRPFARAAGDRIERTVRGGCYRSRWLRDLCTSPDVTAAMASIYGVDVAHHTMPLHLGHLNYEPEQAGSPVDKWHHDTIPLDFVLMVTDPATFRGGRFEWFRGTKHEMEDLSHQGSTPPRDRVVVPNFPGAGYAIALHGDMVIHRGAALEEAGERITMVNGYVAMDRCADEQSRTRDLVPVDDPEVLYAEWARHVAWRAAGRLEGLLRDLDFGVDRSEARARLLDAVADVNQAIEEMDPTYDPGPAAHYERPTDPSAG